MLIKELGDGV
jgi:serine/threonine protein kinase